MSFQIFDSNAENVNNQNKMKFSDQKQQPSKNQLFDSTNYLKKINNYESQIEQLTKMYQQKIEELNNMQQFCDNLKGKYKKLKAHCKELTYAMKHQQIPVQQPKQDEIKQSLIFKVQELQSAVKDIENVQVQQEQLETLKQENVSLEKEVKRISQLNKELSEQFRLKYQKLNEVQQINQQLIQQINQTQKENEKLKRYIQQNQQNFANNF